MDIKKYPNAMLENYSKILVQLGFVLSLFIVYQFFQLKSYPSEIGELTGTTVLTDESVELVDIKPMEPLKTPPPKVAVLENIVKVEDEVEINESIIESTETDESEAIDITIDQDIMSVEEEEVVEEDVPFIIIEEVPIFPGCTGNKEQLRACFSSEISKFVQKKFNPSLGSDLGLPQGSIQKIFVVFRIDSNGNISDIKARAPHKKLQLEAEKIIGSLPKMIPGKQRGKPVSVSYGLPIVFKIE
jgi:protein TonB